MGIDYGPTICEQLLKIKYIKTTHGGYVFTEEGINFLFNSIQELYHENKTIHERFSCGNNCTNCPSTSVDRSDQSREDSV